MSTLSVYFKVSGRKTCIRIRFMAGFGRYVVSSYKIFRWIVLVVGILVVFMMFRRPSPPSLPMTPQETKQQAESYDRKLNQLVAAPRSEGAEARFTSDEVTAAIAQQMTEPAASAGSAVSSQKSPELTPHSQVAENTPIRTVGVDFHGDQVTGQFIVSLYGRDVYVTISGRLASKDGYATFEPSGFKVGDLVIPASAVNDALQKKLAEPENREKLKLPDFVQSIRVENGELVVEKKS